MAFVGTNYEALADVKEASKTVFEEMEDNLKTINRTVQDMQSDWEGSSNVAYTEAVGRLNDEFNKDRTMFNDYLKTQLSYWSENVDENEQSITQNSDDNITVK